MMKTTSFVICAMLASTLPASAESYRAVNRLIVNPISATEFDVIESHGAGARQIWCAAAEYNEKVLRNVRQSELIVKTARGPSVTSPGSKGVVFTNNPANVSVPVTKAVSVSVKVAGQSLSSNHARQFCADAFIQSRD
jgi:hypothetical protein